MIRGVGLVLVCIGVLVLAALLGAVLMGSVMSIGGSVEGMWGG